MSIDTGKNEDIVRRKQGLLVVFVIIVIVLGSVVALIAGKTYFADSEIMDWIWWAVWLGVLPLILALSFRAAVKGKDEKTKNRGK